MNRLSIRGIIIGGLTQAALNAVAGVVLGVVIFCMAIERCRYGGSSCAAEAVNEINIEITPRLSIASPIFSFFGSALGGFIAVTIAKHAEIWNAILTVWPIILIVMALPLLDDLSPANFHQDILPMESFGAIFIGLIASACGGYLAMPRN